jgi:hypothetical protein
LITGQSLVWVQNDNERLFMLITGHSLVWV